jgi:hypothetical protein
MQCAKGKRGRGGDGGRTRTASARWFRLVAEQCLPIAPTGRIGEARRAPGDAEALGASAHELEDREEGAPPPIEVVC